MDIKQLTEKIYEEGISRAKEQEQQIVDDAHRTAEKIVAEAREQAQGLLDQARADAAAERERLETDLRLAAKQAVAELRGTITDLLVDSTLGDSVRNAVSNEGFIPGVIRDIVARWSSEESNVALEVVLPELERERLSAYFSGKEKELLDRGLRVDFSRNVKAGFEIRPQNGNYKIAFDEQDFIRFFRPFLRKRTREILFPAGAQESVR